MGPADLAEAVRSLRRASVLVVGDAMLDRTVYGRVTRISPEAPVPVLAVEREVAMPGGAGNVVRNLTALGTSVAFLSVVGDDQAGSDLTGLIGGQPGVEPWLLVQGGRATTTKTRFMASGQQLLRTDHEVAQPVHPRLADRLIRIAQDTVAATKVMVLSDYRKGVLAGDVTPRLIVAAHAAGRRVVVDPKGEDFSLYAGADLIVPNRAELHRATGMEVDGEAAVVAAARSLRERHGFGAVLVTRGQHGMTLLDGDGLHHFPAEAAEVADISGAGDTVVAVVAAAMAAGLPVPVAARLSNIAAGLVVGKLGTAVAQDTELLEALGGQHGALRKIVSRGRAAEQAERWRRRGWRVGFTDGHFDLLHPGHLHLLEQARRWCDRLIVGVHVDDAVRRLKGPTRPVQAEAARAAILASLPAVDLVTFFEEDTPLALIEALRPDVLVKGADHRADEIPGGLLVQEWGGVVRLADLLPDAEAAVARLGLGLKG
ncbi:bifunctional heptose 7-phosphate kinase/heptose 1-phosphate adenyltransferase [Roseomonas populi]|uniref:Bifunctional protein HldE n=1 Tax=Roseomonas populi TaxID=3121582 RepID=A0ABT1X9L7_9PROT|nr:bifunctional heptose 7-phosphate kinase/heptose 1-phosphate adenyltransferase [Roseomonas pecuniae]MCR0984806.1 bifunctional heptose 7-phosphate kinase/heptose 1-phosphate adenyltransferase [Roseomonas pecuniae]